MKNLIDELDNLMGEIAVSRDLVRILFEETDCVPKDVAVIYNDASQAARAAYLLSRIQTLISVCFSRINRETEKLESIFERMHKELHAHK